MGHLLRENARALSEPATKDGILGYSSLGERLGSGVAQQAFRLGPGIMEFEPGSRSFDFPFFILPRFVRSILALPGLDAHPEWIPRFFLHVLFFFFSLGGSLIQRRDSRTRMRV